LSLVSNTAGRVQETPRILDELIDSPDPQTLEAFISRIPMVFRIACVSHGWFGQEGVLGVLILTGSVCPDQAKSLENSYNKIPRWLGWMYWRPLKVIILTRLINSDGTLCNQRLEKSRTENAWILRVPLREFNPT